MNVTFRPIPTWPGQMTRSRKHSPFKAGYDRTLKDLERELQHLGAKSVVVQLALGEKEIRRDGLPYSNARPTHPGVILAFQSKHGPLSYPCDTYTAWQDNLRAIVLALTALRAVDRYGVTRRAEQYRGWAQLPPGTTGGLSLEQAAAFVAAAAGGTFIAASVQADLDVFQSAYREAAKKLHPDANSGNERPEWKRLQDAAEILRKHHGGQS